MLFSLEKTLPKKVSLGMTIKIAKKPINPHENIKEFACIYFSFLCDAFMR